MCIFVFKRKQLSSFRKSWLLRLMLILEQYGKQNTHNQSKRRKNIPCRRPASHQVKTWVSGGGVEHEMVHDRLGAQRADSGTEAIGHHHEHTLRTRTDAWVCVLVNEERAADVEEIEGHTVDNHGKDEQHEAETCRTACTKEEETQCPCNKGDEHHLLDAELLQEEGDEQE